MGLDYRARVGACDRRESRAVAGKGRLLRPEDQPPAAASCSSS
jgi:hypothetical protein